MVGLPLLSFTGNLAVVLLVGAVYEIIFVILKGQTPGKMAAGIKVVRPDNGSLPGRGASAVRWAIQAVGYVLLIIPGLLVHVSILGNDDLASDPSKGIT